MPPSILVDLCRHALVINTVINELDLRNNGLDSVVGWVYRV